MLVNLIAVFKLGLNEVTCVTYPYQNDGRNRRKKTRHRAKELSGAGCVSSIGLSKTTFTDGPCGFRRLFLTVAHVHEIMAYFVLLCASALITNHIVSKTACLPSCTLPCSLCCTWMHLTVQLSLVQNAHIDKFGLL